MGLDVLLRLVVHLNARGFISKLWNGSLWHLFSEVGLEGALSQFIGLSLRLDLLPEHLHFDLSLDLLQRGFFFWHLACYCS